MALTAKEVSWDTHRKVLLDIRTEVFVVEQNVPVELEDDGEDVNCYHVLLELDNKAIGCARVVKDGHIGRVAVLKEHRGKGYGKIIMEEAEKIAVSHGIYKIILHAQYYIKDFYTDLGYAEQGEPFQEAGIKHITMVKELEKSKLFS